MLHINELANQSSNEVKVTEIDFIFFPLPIWGWWIAFISLALLFTVSLWINAEDHSKLTSYLQNYFLKLKVIWMLDYQKFPKGHSLSLLSRCQLNWNLSISLCSVWIHSNLTEANASFLIYNFMKGICSQCRDIFHTQFTLWLSLACCYINLLVLSVNTKIVASINNK